MPRALDSVPSATTDAARRAGAQEIMEGELDVGPAGLVLSLRRAELQPGVLRQGYTVRAADRNGVIDSEEAERLSATTTERERLLIRSEAAGHKASVAVFTSERPSN